MKTRLLTLSKDQYFLFGLMGIPAELTSAETARERLEELAKEKEMGVVFLDGELAGICEKEIASLQGRRSPIIELLPARGESFASGLEAMLRVNRAG